jgi:glucokinase
MSRKSLKKVLAYDLGGTKVAAAVVNAQGKVLDEIRVPVMIQQGKKAVLRQLVDLGKELIALHPDVGRVGMASAGPLDPDHGMLLDPTNFTSAEGSWGKTPIAAILKKALKREVILENDAAAAVLAEVWKGKGQGHKNVMVLTLGTGLGTGIYLNGELLRAGRHLHPEAGHIILRAGDTTAPCGCGNLGCAEAFLSGRSFARRARQRFARPELTAKDITELAHQNDPRALAAFVEYSEMMAVALYSYCVIYCPELVVFTGSFAAASPYFLRATKEHLKTFLARRRKGVDLLPKMAISSLDNRAGILGGAYVAFHAEKVKPPKSRK